jgi:predicted HTH transcriptional regulator
MTSAREALDQISDGESGSVEFKRKFTSSEKIAREIIAFANSHGGRLFIGVDDDRSIVGVKSEKEEMEMVDIACTFFCDPPITPQIEVLNLRGKDVLMVKVPESNNKPHWLVTNGQERSERQAFIRLNDKTVAASKEVVRMMKSQRADAPPMKISIGRIERTLFEYLREHERVTVKEFKHLANISERRASIILVRLVRAGVLYIHTFEKEEFFTFTGDPAEAGTRKG